MKTVNVLGYFGEDRYIYGYLQYMKGILSLGYAFCFSRGEFETIDNDEIIAWRYFEESEKFHESLKC